jgi:hypothetical protein
MSRVPDQTVGERIDNLYIRCLGRRPSDQEQRVLVNLFETLRQQYRVNPEAATALVGPSVDLTAPREDIAACIGVVRVVMNTDKFTSRE